MMRKTCYGRLEFILECNTHNGNGTVPTPIPRCHLLAVITRCKTPSSADATRELVTYTSMATTPHVINLATVGAVIGRFLVSGTQSRWAIVDRSGELAHAVFTNEIEELCDLDL